MGRSKATRTSLKRKGLTLRASVQLRPPVSTAILTRVRTAIMAFTTSDPPDSRTGGTWNDRTGMDTDSGPVSSREDCLRSRAGDFLKAETPNVTAPSGSSRGPTLLHGDSPPAVRPAGRLEWGLGWPLPELARAVDTAKTPEAARRLRARVRCRGPHIPMDKLDRLVSEHMADKMRGPRSECLYLCEGVSGPAR